MKRGLALFRAIFLIVTLLPSLLLSQARAQGTSRVDVLTVKGAITPIVAGYIERGIDLAQREGAEVLIIQLDTPGGAVEITGRIVRALDNARVPVVVYVSPQGARAASAGTFITLAGHLAAMAPRTTIGAAHPVGPQGEEISETAEKKVVNDLVASIKSHARRRGEKAVEWAEKAVRQSVSATEQEAFELGVVDFLADDLDDLLSQLNGHEVEVAGETVVLNTEGATVNRLPMTLVENLLHTITDPNIAFILLTLGINGILFELSSPGGWLAGTVGGICLLLALYAMGILSVDYTGLLFIVLAIILFIMDIKAPTHGALTAGGIISFTLGTLILFNSPFYAISRSLVIGVALGTGGFFAFVVRAALMAQRRRPTTGWEGLIGQMAVARTSIDPTGTILVQGELWEAESDGQRIEAGERVQVTAMKGFRLQVRKLD